MPSRTPAATEAAATPFAWRRIAVPAYGPSLLAGAATGAVLPVAALRAADLGASLGTAALVVALLGVGQLLGALPAGALVARVGERSALLRAGAVDVLALLVAGFAPSLALMAVALLVSGVSSAVFFLARQGYMIDALPPDRLARGMSLLGGAMRAGLLVGPAAGALAISNVGLGGAYAVAVAFALLSLVIVAASPDLTAGHEDGAAPAPVAGVVAVMRAHAPTLLTTGLGIAVINALRQARLVILPLWALHLGLGGVESSTVFAAAGIAELLVVYPSGWVMDRLGRVWVVVPHVLVLSGAMLALPAARDLTGLVVVAVALAAGNGLGSGLVMTLGADLAPRVHRAQFLGGWRLCGEAGSCAGGLLVTGVTALATLSAAAVTLGGVGLLGGAWTAYWVRQGDTRRRARAQSGG